MAFTRALALAVCLVAVLFATPTATQTIKGLSCVEFDSFVCNAQPEGTVFENMADCGSPYCKTTYIRCSNGGPNVINCNETMVWSQSNKACIPRSEAPGTCPATCGLINITLCDGVEDGTRLFNPTDCLQNNVVSSYVYCRKQLPILTVCPNSTTWSNTTNTCVRANGDEVMNSPFDNVPETLTVPKNNTTTVAPGPSDNEFSGLLTPSLTKPGVAGAPKPAPPKDDKDEGEDDEVDEGVAPAPGPYYSEGMPEPIYEEANITITVSGSDLQDLTPLMVEEAMYNVTGLKVTVDENIEYGLTMQLSLNDFEWTQELSDEIMQQDVEDGVQWVVVNAFEDYVKREGVIVSVNPGSPDLSTASANPQQSTVEANVVVKPTESEVTNAADLVKALPTFDMTIAQIMAESNNTKEVSQIMYEYLQKEQLSVSSYKMMATLMVHHPSGTDGNAQIQKAIETGAYEESLSTLLGANVDSAVVAMNGVDITAASPAPAPGSPPGVPISGTNSAVATGVTLSTLLLLALTTLYVLW